MNLRVAMLKVIIEKRKKKIRSNFIMFWILLGLALAIIIFEITLIIIYKQSFQFIEVWICLALVYATFWRFTILEKKNKIDRVKLNKIYVKDILEELGRKPE